MATARLFLTNPATDFFNDTFICEAWFHDGTNRSEMNAVQVATITLTNDSSTVAYVEPGFAEMMSYLPIADGLDFTVRVLGAINHRFDTECETHADAFDDGDITVLQMNTELEIAE
jgi:hypothetical protein